MKSRWLQTTLILVVCLALVAGCAPTLAGPTPPGGEVQVSNAEQARDVALERLSWEWGDEVLPAGLIWTEKRVTPEGLLGSETYEYGAGDWTVTVSYPVTSLEQTIWDVRVSNPVTGLEWQGRVSARGEVIESTSPGEPNPTPGASDLAALAEGNTEFALALYRWMAGDTTRNLFFSPYSISAALAMTYAGARGETQRQMAQAMHFGLPQAVLHPAFEALAQELEKRGEGAAGKDDEGFRLNVASALWGQERYAFRAEFIDLLARHYDAGLRQLDFGRSEEARAIINDWVSEKTEERIQDLIPAGVLNEMTRLVLTNAIYFNAAWARPFDEKATRDDTFYGLLGRPVTVPMMTQTGSYLYTEGEDYQALELPYDGYEMSMVILLPRHDRFEVFPRQLSGVALQAILDRLAPQQVEVTLPRFEFESSFSLAEALSELGMPVAFSPGEADFSGMDGTRDLFISAVLHKAFVSVDEAGTEAAAATAVVMEVTSIMPTEPVQFKADRPFVFLIRDRQTGALLFMGQVIDPSE